MRFWPRKGYFSLSKFRKWLNDVRASRVEQNSGNKPETEGAFLELYEATKMELNMRVSESLCYVLENITQTF